MSIQAGSEPTVGGLLSLATHDLRNPLSVLLTNLGYLESVVTMGDVEECQAVLADLGIACDALARYLSNLDVLGGNLSARPLLRARTSVRGLVQGSVARVQIALIQQCLRVQVDVDADCPDVVVDSDLASRGLENLLANAAVFAPRDSVVRVHASALPGGDFVRLSIFDDGAPVPPQHRPLAFQAAGQELLHRDAASRYGRGLGLLVAGIVAERLGGAVAATTNGDTACFVLDLPVAPPDSSLEAHAVPTFRPAGADASPATDEAPEPSSK